MRAVLAHGIAKSPIVEDLIEILRGASPRTAAA
jgi:hypothetical protein